MQCQDVAFPLPPWGQPLRGHAVAGPHADQPHRLAELRSAVRGLSPLRPRSPHRLEGGPFSRRREGPFSTCRQHLGTNRSYQALAQVLGVTKRAVTKCAAREKWSERLTKIEQSARERSDLRLTETMEQMRDRHMATLKAMHARALSALVQYPLTNGMDAMRAAEMAIKLERLVAGESPETGAREVEAIIRREHERWLVEEEPVVEVAAEEPVSADAGANGREPRDP